jgi:hypothetical protein
LSDLRRSCSSGSICRIGWYAASGLSMTYMKEVGRLMYLYLAIDSVGNPVGPSSASIETWWPPSA